MQILQEYYHFIDYKKQKELLKEIFSGKNTAH